MLPTTSLIQKLKKDFPQYAFKVSDDYRWSFKQRAIFYSPKLDDAAALLHEVAHGELSHASYSRDIQLLAIERDAWQYAIEVLAPKYQIDINRSDTEDALDTYRDWLHSRSTCPSCQATGIEKRRLLYFCLACHASWQVNDARQCALRRYVIRT